MRILLLSFAVACGPKTITISGTVLDGPGSQRGAAGASLDVFAPEGDTIAQAETDAEGFFSFDIEPGINVFVGIDAPGARLSYFAGAIGAVDEVIADGLLYTFPEDDASAIEAAFEGCPGGDGVGLVAGVVRHFDIVDALGEPAVNTASRVTLLLEDGSEQRACYADENGEAYDPDGAFTGASGRFVLPGVPAGVHTLEIAYDVSLEVSESRTYPAYVGEEVSLSPWYPAWVTLPER